MIKSQTMIDSPRHAGPATRRKLAITVLRGGPSREREVSLHSGAEVAVALETLGHNVLSADIGPANLSALESPADVVFIALHGTFGEDGQIQRILDARGIAYTGSGAAACALAMNKAAAKQRLIESGLPTPPFAVVRDRDDPRLTRWALPAVVKPVSEGSSILCFIIREAADLRPAVQQVLDAYGEALVEQYIPGLELTVGILADRWLPPIEIRATGGFYDYHAKYEADDTEYRFDIQLPADLLDDIGRMSLAAHRALGCRDFSRVDWRVDAAAARPYILEVNTIPGFTQHSLLPMAARKAGLSMPELCGMLVESALGRGARE